MNINLLVSNKNKFEKLLECGQSPWLDNISRCMIDSGELKSLVDNNIITGITSNPSIFEKAIDSGKCNYPETIKKMSSPQSLDAFKIYDAITQKDIKDAAKILYPIYKKTEGNDGFVSIEVPPNIATDTETSVKEAMRIFYSINEPNLLIKIPATKEGLPAITQIIAKGINVNVTLMFSLTHYINVADAYMEGLEIALKNGISINKIHSVASVFISRLDTMIDTLLDNILKNNNNADNKSKIISLKGMAAVANIKVIYNKFFEIFNSGRFKKLESMGANIQKPLWASTSTKNPDYYDLKYVEPLIAKNTVNTLPEQTIESIADHGNIKSDTVSYDFENSVNILNELKKLGIDTEQAGEILQKEGVKSFEESYDKLLDLIKNV